MVSYIKNNYCYIGSIRFRIDPTAYIREPDHYHDLPTLCPNIKPLFQHGNWFVEWGIENLQEGMDLKENALAYCTADGEVKDFVCLQLSEVQHNNMKGIRIYWGDEYQQDMRIVFPHEEGLYFVHVVLRIPGTPGLQEIKQVCQDKIIQTLLSTICRDETMVDVTKRGLKHLGLTLRVYNALQRSGRETIEDLLRMDYEDLFRVRGLGEKGRAEILQKLTAYGFNVEHLEDTKKGNNNIC